MKRLLIDACGTAVRTALLNDTVLREIYINPKEDGSRVGQIILGVVKNILPSQFAFIDIGCDKNAFMNLRAQAGLKTGKPVLVQVQKDATGNKGANVSEHIHVNGRLTIVYESNRREIGVSQKITDKAERERLHDIAERALPPGFGAIMRTNSAEKSEAEITADINRLLTLYHSIQEQSRYAKAPAVLYQENPLLNDLLSDDLAAILVNEPAEFERIRQTIGVSAPALVERVLFFDEAPDNRLFEVYGVEPQITQALQNKALLPCGGYVIIEQTEACVIIDVNTGKFPGRANYRETVLQTNLEAAACIAAQIALRNLTGMIIVDFIDMYEEEDKIKLVRFFTAALKKDRIKTGIVGMTSLGLVQLTRKKTRESLSRLLECECPHCQGTGRIRKR